MPRFLPSRSARRPRPSRPRARRISTLNRYRAAVFLLFLAVFVASSEMPR